MEGDLNFCWQMEEGFNFLENRRQPKIRQTEDNLNFGQIENDLNIMVNGRQSQLFL